jgi:hypothetical protein
LALAELYFRDGDIAHAAALATWLVSEVDERSEILPRAVALQAAIDEKRGPLP